MSRIPRLRGCLWLTAGLVLALAAGAMIYFWLTGMSVQAEAGPIAQAGSEQDVVVAARTIDVGTRLAPGDLEVKAMPVEALPSGYLDSVDSAVGKVTTADLYPGEIILMQRLVDPNVISGDGRVAVVVADGEVLMAFPIRDLMSQLDILKAGDHVDLLFSLNLPTSRSVVLLPAEGEGAEAPSSGGAVGEEGQVTFDLLENVTVAAIVSGGEGLPPNALLLTVSPQDALLIKFALDAGGAVTVVLRPPGVEEPYDTEPVDVNYMIDRYGIPGRR